MCTYEHFVVKCVVPSTISKIAAMIDERYRCASGSTTVKRRGTPPQKLVRFGNACPLGGKSEVLVVRFAEMAEIFQLTS